MSRAITPTGGFRRFARPDALAALVCACFLQACAGSPGPSVPDHRPATSSLDLRPLSGFAALDGWDRHDARAALVSFGRSCEAILRRPADRALSDRVSYAGRAGDWHEVCEDALRLIAFNADARAARQFFEARFTPVAVGGDGRLTGYYEPMVDVRRYPDTEFSMFSPS